MHTLIVYESMYGNTHASAEPFDDIQLREPAATQVPWHGDDDGSRLDYLKAHAWHRPAGNGKCLIFMTRSDVSITRS